MADESADGKAAKPPKSGGIAGKLVNGIGILVLVVGGNLLTNLIVRDFLPDLAPAAAMASADEKGGKAAKSKKEKKQGPPIYLALDPPLVASVDDGQAIRFVQLTVEVMGREQQTLDAVVAHTPVIRNNLLMLLGRKSIEELTSSEGKETLRAEALEEVRSILEKMGPADPDLPLGELEDLYFTSFVVQ
jgi:flagellar FliL protein